MKKKVGILLILIMVVAVFVIAGRYNGIIGIVKQNIEGESGGSKVISEVVVPIIDTAQAQEQQVEVSLEDLQKLSYTEGYAYNLLSEEEQQIYVEILSALSGLERDVILSSADVDQVVKIHEYVCADNPELFWVEGYEIRPYEMAGKTVKVKYSGIYTMGRGEKENYQIALEQKVAGWLADIAECNSDYEKVKKAYQLIILNTEYDPEAEA